MAGLLSQLFDPSQDSSLLNFAANLAQQSGGARTNTAANIAGAISAGRQQQAKHQEYMRQEKVRELQEQVMAGRGSDDVLKMLYTFGGPEAVSKVLAARLSPLQQKMPTGTIQELDRHNEDRARQGLPPETYAEFVKKYGQKFGTTSVVVQTPQGPQVVSTGNRGGARTTGLPNLPVDQDPDIAGDKTEAMEDAKVRSDAKAQIGKVEASTDLVLKTLGDLEGHPGLDMATGASRYSGAHLLKGTPARGAQAIINKIGGQAFLQAFDSIKGGGHITEIEGLKATQAITTLSDPDIPDEEYRAAIKDFKEVVSAGWRRALKKAGLPYRPPQSELPPGVTEADIQTTMQKHNMTREQVLERLNSGR